MAKIQDVKAGIVTILTGGCTRTVDSLARCLANIHDATGNFIDTSPATVRKALAGLVASGAVEIDRHSRRPGGRSGSTATTYRAKR